MYLVVNSCPTRLPVMTPTMRISGTGSNAPNNNGASNHNGTSIQGYCIAGHCLTLGVVVGVSIAVLAIIIIICIICCCCCIRCCKLGRKTEQQVPPPNYPAFGSLELMPLPKPVNSIDLSTGPSSPPALPPRPVRVQ